jgi:uncharacterized spore protein YtfJ
MPWANLGGSEGREKTLTKDHGRGLARGGVKRPAFILVVLAVAGIVLHLILPVR